MPRPRTHSTAAIVLRQRTIGEADKVLTLYTANAGKAEVIARGVRKARSRLAGYVEPLSHATFQLAQGRTFDVVTQVEPIETFGPLRADLDRLARALYAAELLDRFTEPREPHPDLYRLLLETLRRLEQQPDFELPLRFFEMALLDVLGYRPELDECVVCRAPLRPETNYWSAGAGGVMCRECLQPDTTVHPLSANALKLLRLLLHGRWPEVARVRVDADLAGELERALLEYVRWVLERDVRSAAFIEAVRRRRVPARRA